MNVVKDELSKKRKSDFNQFLLAEKGPKDEVSRLQEIVLNEDVVMLHRYAVLDEKLCREKINDASHQIKDHNYKELKKALGKAKKDCDRIELFFMKTYRRSQRANTDQ